MPGYSYNAIDQSSKKIAGFLVSENETIAEQYLSESGLFLVDLKLANTDEQSKKVNVSRLELVDLFRGLGAMLEAGIDAAQSLSVLRDETERKDLRNVLADLKLNVESGIALDEAMSNHPTIFDLEICNLIKAGSHSGNLVEACVDVADHLEWMDKLLSDIKQATVYPAFVITAVFGLIMLLFLFVVPQFATIFDSLDLELPLITQAVVAVGDFTARYWWLFLSMIAMCLWALWYLPKRHARFGLLIDSLKYKLPLFGPLILLLSQSRFTHNMSLMLKAGVPIVDALQLISGVVGNREFANVVDDARHAVTEGRPMSDGLAAHKDIFTPIVMRIIIIGEESGKLEYCLEMISTRLDAEIPRRIKRMFGVLEPLIILTLIGVVGLVAAAIFLPLFSLMSGAMA